MIDATRSTHNQEIVNSYVTGYNKGKLDSKIQFIDKACEWLESSLKHNLRYYSAEDFVDTFRKAMEE